MTRFGSLPKVVHSINRSKILRPARVQSSELPPQEAPRFYANIKSPARNRQRPQSFRGAHIPSIEVIGKKEGFHQYIVRSDVRVRNADPTRTPWFFIETRPILKQQDEFVLSHIRMLNYLEIITTPTADTAGSSILFHFDNRRYIFGQIAEGTQRAMTQRKIAINKVEDIFITGPMGWHSAGGLLGLVLTIADVGATSRDASLAAAKLAQASGRKTKSNPVDDIAPKLNIHGGKNLAYLLATARRFIFRKGLPLQPHEVKEDPRVAKKESSEPDFQDVNINVWYVPVQSASNHSPSKRPRKRSHDEFSSSDEQDNAASQCLSIVSQMFNSDWKMDALVETTLHEAKLPAKLFVRDEHGHIQVYKGLLPGEGNEVANIPVLVRQPWPGATIKELPATEPSNQSLCYIVKGHDRRGRFNPKEAERLGVEKRDYSKLTRGQTVQGKDGVFVTPEMVLGETVQGKGFAVIDIPDPSYIERLVKRPEWTNQGIMNGVHLMLWLSGPGVMNDARIQEFMKKNDGLKHIVCSGDHSPNMIPFESAAAQALKLHRIDPDRFHLPIYSNELSLSSRKVADFATEACQAGRTGKTVQFAPQYIHQDEKIVPFPDLEKISVKDGPIPDTVVQLAQAAKDKISAPSFSSLVEKVESDIPNRDAEIITLGTGSALPSKYRNVSATLVRVPGYGNYLFDCGENTLGQLHRVFGNELPSILRDLKVIWISHMHADHHLGTASVLKAWHKETEVSKPSAKLHVASHWQMHSFLKEYSHAEDIGYSRLTTSSFNKPAVGDIFDPKTLDATQYGVEKIDVCCVKHCLGSLATVFTFPSGLKIAYSGDCRPSDAFVKIGQGTTLLIHESTFEDELRGDAIAKKHSTMSEAIEVGRKMGARRIMLTHFSQRYQKVPVMEEGFNINPDAVAKEGTDKAKVDEVILVGFDYMRVKLGEFRHAQAFLPAINKLLENAEQ